MLENIEKYMSLLEQKKLMAGIIWLGMAAKCLEHTIDEGLSKEFDMLVKAFKGRFTY